jgi:hypothetical protein
MGVWPRIFAVRLHGPGPLDPIGLVHRGQEPLATKRLDWRVRIALPVAATFEWHSPHELLPSCSGTMKPDCVPAAGRVPLAVGIVEIARPADADAMSAVVLQACPPSCSQDGAPARHSWLGVPPSPFRRIRGSTPCLPICRGCRVRRPFVRRGPSRRRSRIHRKNRSELAARRSPLSP